MLDLSCVPSTLGADYYLGNLHKWCMAPVSVAVMWISPTAPSRPHIHHPIVSHHFREGLGAEFAMLGTRDYSSLLACTAALDFIYKTFGGIGAMYARNHQLCLDAIRMLSKAWETESACLPESLHTSMGMVPLPAELGHTMEDNERLRLELRAWKPHNRDPVPDSASTPTHTSAFPMPRDVCGGIIVQWCFPVPGDRMYLRVSAAVYNYIEEFEVLRDAVLDIQNRRRETQ
jgi:selenocysteine lyase/cysteine desulfurase